MGAGLLSLQIELTVAICAIILNFCAIIFTYLDGLLFKSDLLQMSSSRPVLEPHLG